MSLFSSIADFLTPTPPPSPVVTKALDKVAELVDPLLKSASGFERKLAVPLEHALGYCEGLIAGLPGPIDIDREAFARDPLVHALFATADDIVQMLGRSEAVRDFVASPERLDSDHFFALFAARRHEKKQLGMARQGDMIQADVPQVVVYFNDQLLLEPHCDLAVLQERLRSRTMESLLLTFREHVAALRLERDGLRADASMERAHLTVLRGKTESEDHALHTRHLGDLEAKLRATAESLMPDQILEALADFLGKPETSLATSSQRITIDRLGVVCDENSDDSNVSTLDFPEIRGRDKRIYVVTLARISRAEAEEAVDRVRDQQRRFMII
jgi:hypothetical protein